MPGIAADGRDPFVERKAKAAAAQKAKAEAEHSFSALVAEWAKAREGDRRHSYLREAVACLKRNLPVWLNRPASSITFSDAVRAVDRIKAEKGTVAANRTLSYARAAYGWAVKRQHVAVNPLKGIERAGREAPRERVLSETELGAIWRGCDALGAIAAGFVRTLMLTLQRRDEVASMLWGELDNPIDPAIWTLPAERTKNARAPYRPSVRPDCGRSFATCHGSRAIRSCSPLNRKDRSKDFHASRIASMPRWRRAATRSTTGAFMISAARA